MFKPGDKVVRKPEYREVDDYEYEDRILTVIKVELTRGVVRFLEDTASEYIIERFELADKEQFNNLIDMYYDLRRD